ncbi:SCO family protein [Hymenobacter psychrophilus]|uniref:Protein SCO1/2 n=1 Tax=Hymenobacter psychrophilus TaxID=651662 RepID=A0A1H3LAV2_9BACT|nr:SCO family protein [Hymenobacter psychrophilus]SDY61542.1 protein SCO1/2 [Hymenobacter psychrophilus]
MFNFRQPAHPTPGPSPSGEGCVLLELASGTPLPEGRGRGWGAPSARTCRRLLPLAAALLLAACRPDAPPTVQTPIALAAAAPAAAVTRLPFYHEATFTPHWYPTGQAPPDSLHVVGPFRFTDQSGQAVTNTTLAGHVYLANFFFTECPGICPRMNDNLAQVLRRFANEPDLRAVSYSVMPERDQVPVLRAYAESRGIDGRRWHLLTGPKAAIYQLARTQYFADQSLNAAADTSRFLHTEHILLVDRTGHLRGLYNGTLALDVDRMSEDVALLLKEE